ncbi:MAG TPA: imidazolonepropionase, partial [Rhizomicrobium sp.]|nr:imidazolonepropionase [Rhizomicrobium sp.]
MHADIVWHNARLATLTGPGLGIVEHGTIAANNGRIVYAGPSADAPRFDATDTINCDSRWITPGLVDCHTHLIYAGDRAREFQMRLEGASYEEIARAGGGIVSTVRATRAASEAELIASALARLDTLISEGLCSIEIKSGYGLSLEHEMKMLRAARALAERRNVRVTTTFLGAHALPPEAGGNADTYIDLVCEEMMPA